MSQPPSASDQISEAWRRHRPYLVNLAYQMLGDVGDAEDVAQEAFLRLSRADINGIEDFRAWLTVVAGRLCLDQVRSARARYERPADIGPEVAALNQSQRLDPADQVTLDDEVRTALLEVLRGGAPMTSEVARRVVESFRAATKSPKPAVHLSAREEEVLILLSKGYANKEIADQLSISVETVGSHLKHIYEKMHVRSRAEAVARYITDKP